MKQFFQEVDQISNRNTPEFQLIFAIIKQAQLDLTNPLYAESAKKFLEKDIEFYTNILRGYK